MKKTWIMLALLAVSFGAKAGVESNPDLQLATFAGGCFWCMEKPFDAIDGVISTVSGYTGGHKRKPTYRQVSSGRTGHTEAIQIEFDPSRVTYAQLLKVFWRNIDPLDGGGQFCDRGNQYRPGVFFHDANQQQAAEQSLVQLKDGALKGKSVEAEITQVTKFYPAEEYHQNYYQKNPVRYKYYRYRCGRDDRLRAVWGAKK